MTTMEAPEVTDLRRAIDRETARPEWPDLSTRIIRMGGIDGLGQIAEADIPPGLARGRDARGRLLPVAARVAYDELPAALAETGRADLAEMDGDELLAYLWRAWDEWDGLRAGGPEAEPFAEDCGETEATEAEDLAVPDAGDEADAEILAAFGALDSSRVPLARDLTDTTRLAEVAARAASAVTIRAPRTREVTWEQFGERWLMDADEAEAAALARAREEIAYARSRERRRPAEAPRLTVITGTGPAAAAPPSWAPWAIVGAILAMLAASLAGGAALGAALAGWTIPPVLGAAVLAGPATVASLAAIVPAAVRAARAMARRAPSVTAAAAAAWRAAA